MVASIAYREELASAIRANAPDGSTAAGQARQIVDVACHLAEQSLHRLADDSPILDGPANTMALLIAAQLVEQTLVKAIGEMRAEAQAMGDGFLFNPSSSSSGGRS